MSEFKVDVRKISKVWDHSNADRLSLTSVEGLGFQFVTGKNQFQVGEVVVYFPVDSILPENLIELFGLTGKLSGKEKNRLSTVKLRGEISQGFVAAVDVLQPLVRFPIEEGQDLTEALGVTKYDPPPIACHAGNLVKLPAGVESYDIEGCERFPRVVETLMEQHVTITEKVEGQNYGVTVTEDSVIVNQRNHAIEPIEGKTHSLVDITYKMKLDVLANGIREFLRANQVTLRGEYIGPGVQKNIYKLKENTVKLFDVLVDGKYISWALIKKIIFCLDTDGQWDDVLVPEISYMTTLREWLDGRSIVEASHGNSMLADTLREGIVIKPIDEQTDDSIGRLIIKQRDPHYLAKNGF